MISEISSDGDCHGLPKVTLARRIGRRDRDNQSVDKTASPLLHAASRSKAPFPRAGTHWTCSATTLAM